MRTAIYAAFGAFVLAGGASAAPFQSVANSSGPKDDTAYTFTTKVSGGKGARTFPFTLPGSGVYLATFAANFIPTGSAGSPIAYSCFLTYDSNQNVLQTTAPSGGEVGWDVAVSGSGVVDVKDAHLTLTATCGTGDGSAWKFAQRPLEVTFVKLAEQVKKSL